MQLDEGQHRIVDEIILPTIDVLQTMFSGESTTLEEVVVERKRGIPILGSLIGSAQALALSITATANADEAVQNVAAGAESLKPAVDMLVGLVS